MNQVVITGATSMLGSALINECQKQGTEVLAIIRRGSKRRNDLPVSPLIKVVEKNLDELATWEAPCQSDGSVFFHYAWEATENERRYDVDVQYRNIKYTVDALNLAKRMGCRRFVGAGSQAEYGRVAGTIFSNMNVSPDSAYGVSKYAAGRLCAIQARQNKMDFIWTRIFSTYGVGDMASTMIMYCIDCLLRGKTPALTKCEQQWDYLNCKDAAKAFYLIGEKGIANSIYNIGSGKTKSLLDYVQILRDEINPLLPLGVGEREYSEQQVMHLCPDISDLQRDTGFEPQISFTEGIREAIAWYRKKMHL